MTNNVPPQNCWLWRGTIRQSGYGSDGGRPAHTVAYERVYGPVETGLELYHICENRSCVNPLHLVALTVSQHRRLHRGLISACPQGHEYTETNTRFRAGGERVCRACDRARARKYGKQRYWSDPAYRAKKSRRIAA